VSGLDFATWNVNLVGGANATLRKIEFLHEQRWDVLALQEVTPEAAALFAQAGYNEWIYPTGVQKHAVALAARNGVELAAPALMQGLPIPQRGLWALASVGSLVVEVGSLHITNATNGKSKIKREHYIELVKWLRRPAAARVLGMDANHAYDPRWPDLPDAVYARRGDDWDHEYAFFSADNQHGFKDVWLEQLKRDPDALAAATVRAGTGPSAFSYAKRVRRGELIHDRMDFIFASDLEVDRVVYDDAGRGPGLSDHALVIANLHG
jgi:exonuclease III